MSGKSHFLLAIFILCCALATAQSRWKHTTGFTASYISGFEKDRYGSRSVLLDNSFTYFPRYNLTQDSGTAFSIGFPVSIGIGYVSDFDNRESALSFSYQLPMVFDYNIGYGSSQYNTGQLGGYIGAGVGTFQALFTNKAFSAFSKFLYGPIVRAGMRFAPRRPNGQGVEAGLFYRKGLETAKTWAAGLNIMLHFR